MVHSDEDARAAIRAGDMPLVVEPRVLDLSYDDAVQAMAHAERDQYETEFARFRNLPERLRRGQPIQDEAIGTPSTLAPRYLHEWEMDQPSSGEPPPASPPPSPR